MRKLISLGSNLGDAKAQLLSAARDIWLRLGMPSIQASSIYDTPPVGGPSGQSRFVNAVLAIDSPHPALETWQVLKEIECEMGRLREVRWEARRIDLDLLLCDNHRYWTPHFKLPHPRMMMRRFILHPAREVAQDWIDPVSHWSIAQLDDHLQLPNHHITILSLNPTLESIWWKLMPPDWHRSSTPASTLWQQKHRAVEWILLPHLPATFPWTASLPPNTARYLWGIAQTDAEPWETGTQSWTDWMELTPNQPLHPFLGPRYLLSGRDPAWGVHELLAAFDALECSVQQLDGRCFES